MLMFRGSNGFGNQGKVRWLRPTRLRRRRWPHLRRMLVAVTGISILIFGLTGWLVPASPRPVTASERPGEQRSAGPRTYGRLDTNFFIKLTARDLTAQTHRWNGSKVEVDVSCFYADKDEYRCAGEDARIDFIRIVNERGRDYLQGTCDTLTKALTPACQVTIRFTYDRFATVPRPSGGLIVVIKPSEDTGEILHVASVRN